VAVERYAGALVDDGRSDEAVSLLQPFVAEHPLRDSARLVLMRALHRVGRTADALEQFQEHRHHLAEELGLDPSPALQEAQAELLRAQAPPGTRTPPARPSYGLEGLQVRYLRTDAGNVLAHATTGSGPPVVVVLGWISSLDVISSGRDPRSSLLERLGADLSLTLFDRAGSGLSPGPVPGYGLDASVTELLEVIRSVGPPVSVLAMSAAGPVAVAAAHRRPDWVDSLALFGTFADASATFSDLRLREMVVEITRTHWGMGSKIFADLYRPGVSDEAAWHLAKAFRDSATAEVATGYLEAIFEQDVSGLLPQVEVPSLVLHYRQDRLIPFRGGRDLAAGLPRASFVPLEGRVHLPDVKDIDAIRSAIVGHVRQHAHRR
jgi:pimeloyl-ACP methyl ester carboxylesterase